jgi:hypothetical protein
MRTYIINTSSFGYQLAFTTPGIFPSSESSLKQILQIPNLLRYARERPHRPQRL